MILFQNSILKLDYNPATDILEVEYPNLHTFLLPEIKHTLAKMAEIIRNYDVKKLLLDASKTTIAVSSDESREVALFLVSELLNTRLEKVARLQSSSDSVEKTAKENIRYINQAALLPFQLQNFSDRNEAISWLKAGSNS